MRSRFVIAVAALLAFAASASAQSLVVGDPAPPIKLGKWIKGEPVTTLATGRIYVIEFWATWCPPCRVTIPHLSALQRKYKDDVIVIGISAMENDASAVGPFVERMGDAMNYRVALDDTTEPPGAMVNGWMLPAGRRTLPTAFIVDRAGKVAWIGNAMAVDRPLAQVVAGTFDLAAARAEAERAKAKADAFAAVDPAFTRDVKPLLDRGEIQAAADVLDKLAVAHPVIAAELLNVQFGAWLDKKDYDKAYAVADRIADAAKDDATLLSGLAWTIAAKDGVDRRDLDRALRYATRAAEASTFADADILDTLARVSFDKGDIAKAIKWQTKAVEVAGPDSTETPALKMTLEAYRAKETPAPTTR